MANLPADLPEDWTSNQKISPNGTEVGLSEQHGYNYLMKQVNDTQTEVNNIGTTIEAALEDVAQETSVQQIITTVGTTTDSGGSSTEGSLMAKLNEILAQLGISTTGSTVQEVLEELLNQPKIIKSIQRSVVDSPTSGNTVTTAFTINEINPDKAFVVLDTSKGTVYVRLMSLAATSVTLEYMAPISYQVIEFV